MSNFIEEMEVEEYDPFEDACFTAYLDIQDEFEEIIPFDPSITKKLSVINLDNNQVK